MGRRGPDRFMKRGTKVMIRNHTIDGHLVEEGIAKLVKYIEGEGCGSESWMVRFEGEKELYRRIVGLGAYCDALKEGEK